MWTDRFIALCIAINFATAIDYCGDLKCAKGQTHVGCNNPLSNGGFGPSCSTNAEVVSITNEIAAAIVAVHNKWRNELAMGRTPNYEPAVRMASMKWDDEMSKLAELNARRCEFESDACANTDKYRFVGQNIAMQLASQNTVQDSDLNTLASIASGWFENQYANGEYWHWMTVINEFKLPPQDDEDMSHQIGHFTQVIRDEAHAIGCASTKFLKQFENKEWNATLLVCNYSRNNPLIGDKVYVAGPTASACSTGTHPNYPGLCSEMEVYSEGTDK